MKYIYYFVSAVLSTLLILSSGIPSRSEMQNLKSGSLIGAQSGPEAHPSGEPIVLSLNEAILEALEHDLEIRMERKGPAIKFQEVALELGRFDPRLSSNISHRLSITPRPVSVIEGAFLATDVKSAHLNYGLGVDQKLTPGTDLKLQWSNTRSRDSFQSFNPSFRSAVSFDLSQPLLNGFGITVNRGPILIARNNLSISQETFSAKVMDLVEEVQDIYWDLVFQRKNLQVRRHSLRLALELLEMNRAKVEEGLLAPVEVLVAEAEMAAREEGVLVAEKDLSDVQDRLRRLIRPNDVESLRETAIIPTDEPTQSPHSVELKETVDAALQRNPDLRRARINISNQQVSHHVARNQVLPSLDLQAGAGLNGLGETFGNDLDQMGSGDFYSWEAGLLFSVPIGNREARSNLAKKRLEMERARLELNHLEKGVIVEVTEAVRRVTTDMKRIEATRRARILAEKKLEVESERHRVGLATTHDVLEFQDDLASAQVNELKAILDYNRALVHLDRVRGTILVNNMINLEDPS